MPNWCENEVVITAKDPEVMNAILAKITDENEGFQMSDFMPVPKELEGEVKTYAENHKEEFANALAGNKGYAYTNWYDWSIANWGTKWDMCEVYQSRVGDNTLMIGYSTAWSPNVNFWGEFTKMYPVKISHRYFEEGVCFIGEAIIEDGSIDDYCVDIDEELYKKAGATLDAEGNVDWDADQDYDLYSLFPLRGY